LYITTCIEKQCTWPLSFMAFECCNCWFHKMFLDHKGTN